MKTKTKKVTKTVTMWAHRSYEGAFYVRIARTRKAVEDNGMDRSYQQVCADGFREATGIELETGTLKLTLTAVLPAKRK